MEENNTVYSLPLIGDKAPEFKANTSNGPINFPADYKGKWVVLFSHPADFTPVCTTEFMTFGAMQDEFKALNTELVGLSVDSYSAHVAWLRDIKNIQWGDKKNIDIKFPVIVDISMEVSKKYGMIHPHQGNTAAVRAVFVIDPEGVIRTILYYPMSTGRNFDEIKRIVQALQKADEDSCATPADWRPGDDVIEGLPGDLEAVNKRMDAPSEGMHCAAWYLCFKPGK